MRIVSLLGALSAISLVAANNNATSTPMATMMSTMAGSATTSSPSTCIINNVPTVIPPASQSVQTSNGLISCGTGLNVCTVYDPLTTPNGPVQTCYNGSQYVCLQPSAAYKGQFLCPSSAPNLCGRACYSKPQYQCLVNDTDVYNSVLLQEYSLGGVNFSTGLLALPNNQYQITFLPVNATQVNYVIVHYQSVALDNGVQQNSFVNMTQSTSGSEYKIVVTVPSSQALLYSFTFENTKGQQYDTGAVNFGTHAPSSGQAVSNTSSLGSVITSTGKPTYTSGQSTTTTTQYVIPSSLSGISMTQLQQQIQALGGQYAPLISALLAGSSYNITYDANDCAHATITTTLGSATINACGLQITQNGNTDTITGDFTATVSTIVTDVFGPYINTGSLNTNNLPITGLSSPSSKVNAASSASKVVLTGASLVGAAVVAMLV